MYVNIYYSDICIGNIEYETNDKTSINNSCIVNNNKNPMWEYRNI